MLPTGITLGPSPFNRARGGDVALLSSDNVLFYVGRSVLVDASPFFRDMFSLEQPPHPTPSSGFEVEDALPFPEDSSIVEMLLRLCCGLTEAVVKDIPTISRVLEAARKYQLRDVRDVAKQWIWAHVYTLPLQVYAFSCRYNLEEEAAAAAEVWKERFVHKFRRADSGFSMAVEGASYIPEMDDISSGAYFRLLQYVRTPSDSVDWRPFSFCRPQFSSAYRNAQKRLEQPKRDVPPLLFSEAHAQSVDFVLKSTDGLEFGVHKLVLELAGGKRLLEGATELTSEGLPLCRAGAIGWVLAKVVQLCYPLGAPGVFQDLPAVQEILRFASKYEMAPIINMAKAQLMQLVQSAPLRIYFIAAENGWIEEAGLAARALSIHQIEDQYVPEMEDVSARAYYRLLRYYHECRTVINRITARHSDYVQGWKMVSQGRQKKMSSLSIPLPIVEMWTQKLLAAQCPRPSDHRAAPVVHHRKWRERTEEGKHPVLGLDLQTDFVDATLAMEMDIREELMQVRRIALQPCFSGLTC